MGTHLEIVGLIKILIFKEAAVKGLKDIPKSGVMITTVNAHLWKETKQERSEWWW